MSIAHVWTCHGNTPWLTPFKAGAFEQLSQETSTNKRIGVKAPAHAAAQPAEVPGSVDGLVALGVPPMPSRALTRQRTMSRLPENLIYYSFVALTTLGYDDTVPVHPLGAG